MYTSTPPIGRTACTEHQCLYKSDLYFLLYILNLKDNIQIDLQKVGWAEHITGIWGEARLIQGFGKET